MGLSFGLEHGSVSAEDLGKARQMVPRALEQYVIQLAENGPGNCVGMPQVNPEDRAAIAEARRTGFAARAAILLGPQK